MGIITYNGVSSDELGLVVEYYPNFKSPTRDIEYVHIPGRNGDLLYDHGSYQNVRREYDIAFVSDLKGPNKEEWYKRVHLVSQWLRSGDGYVKLTDDYESGYYSLASYEDGLDIENILMQAGRAKISFNCKPQRYLNDGDMPESISFNISGGRTLEFTNPTISKATPRIGIQLETNTGWEHSGEHPDDSYLPTIEIEGFGQKQNAWGQTVLSKTFEFVIRGWTKNVIPGFIAHDNPIQIKRRIIIDSENKAIYMDPGYYGDIVDIHVNPLKYLQISQEGYDPFPFFTEGANQIIAKVRSGADAGVNGEVVPVERAMIEVQPRWYLI